MSVYRKNIFAFLAEISRVGLDVAQYVIIGEYVMYFEVFFLKNLGGTAERSFVPFIRDEGSFFSVIVFRFIEGEINAKRFS
ncbi:MAG TPA: hypothetical protein DEQ50_10250 [Lactobacillus sp.]|uniref:Uncharacterized protein n=1 Tax=Companilactobacillus formosensis TaxID=1617889 RepID=A0A2P4R653_9LACO|nr:hypothetical protein [Lactobacillus sp.]